MDIQTITQARTAKKEGILSTRKKIKMADAHSVFINKAPSQS